MTPMQQMFLGLGAAQKTYMENLFNIHLRDGSGSAATVTSDVKMSDGSFLWTKARNASHWHVVYDTVRGGSYSLTPNSSNGQANNVAGAVTFNASGYSIASGYAENNATNNTYVDWSLKKTKGFLDIVQYSGDSNSGRTVAHSLGSVPGSIWIKRINSDGGTWTVYHRSLGNTKYLALNEQAAATTSSSRWNNTTPTSSVFTLGNNSSVNTSGNTYIAYVFAHNDQQFGENGDQPAIACGTYTGNGSSTGPEVQVGFQPQFLIIKRAVGGTEHWMMFDEARGVYYYQYDQDIEIGDSGGAGDDRFAINWLDFTGGYDDFQEGGFRITTSYNHINANGNTYVYWAIRRPDGLIGKPPDAGTDVFDCETRTGSDTGDANQKADSDIPGRVDMTITKRTDSGGEYWVLSSRVGGGFALKTNSSGTMVTGATTDNPYDHQSGGAEYTAGNGAANSGDVVDFTWKRHAGFDCLTYKGNGNEHHRIHHSLGKAPEMMWIKSMDTTSYDWHVYHKNTDGGSAPQDKSMHLNTVDGPESNAAFNGSSPGASKFSVGLLNDTNANNTGFFACLFASVDGICKVGSYTGNGSNTGTSVTLGFVPRFLMIKKDGAGVGWNVFSSATTFTNSDSKYMQFNATTELTSDDRVHTTADGFQLQTSNNEVNSNNANYLYYAHA
tara:strand:- start:8 stop:2011 length:2004 start_codon:yes stop_codon:yes gene_type:complete